MPAITPTQTKITVSKGSRTIVRLYVRDPQLALVLSKAQQTAERAGATIATKRVPRALTYEEHLRAEWCDCAPSDWCEHPQSY